jgi:hypothetical protein
MLTWFRHRRFLSHGMFSLWAVLAFVATTSLMAAHLYALPRPDDSDPKLQGAVNSLRTAADRGRWLAVHVLYAQCRCSQRILDHLATSPRPATTREKLLIVGSIEELATTLGRVAARGFDVIETTPVELRDRFHVQAAPLLLVMDPQGSVRYAGGYTERKQGLAIRDVDIIGRLASNQQAEELPLFGCAVSKQLRQLLDPFSLRASTDR